VDGTEDVHPRGVHKAPQCNKHHCWTARLRPNAYAALAKKSTNNEDNNVQTDITQMVALTTQSKMLAVSTAATTSAVMSAINQ
jgi:hypothetical protein